MFHKTKQIITITSLFFALIFTTTIHAQDLTYPFTGLPANSNEDTLRRPIAVMLDNHPKARYQAGLSQADLVYEFQVEGPYTRYMAIFQSQTPRAIGPIRSARPYFVETASDLGAIYTHFGGSPEGNQRIADLSLNDIDGMNVSSSTIWRYNDTGKFAPHNAYTSHQSLQKESQHKDFPIMVQTPSKAFNFAPNFTDIQGSPARKIQLSFNQNNISQFHYQADSQNYQYIKDGTVQVDETDQKPITPTNIIIHQVDYQPISPGGKTLTFQQKEQGTAQLFTAGSQQTIKWTNEKGQPYQYFTEEDQPLQLNPGMTWIAFANDKADIHAQ